MLRNFLVVISVLLVAIPCLSENVWVDENGYHVDGREQLSGSYIEPPHAEKIPQSPHPTQTIVSFSPYYEINEKGERVSGNKLPQIPGYTTHFSERRNHSYRKQEYIDVWCSGQQHVGKVDCMTDEYAISFFPVSEWARGITTASWRARKYPQKGMAFLYVEDVAVDAGDTYDAKKWADLWGVEVFFATIDAGIPLENIR